MAQNAISTWLRVRRRLPVGAPPAGPLPAQQPCSAWQGQLPQPSLKQTPTSPRKPKRWACKPHTAPLLLCRLRCRAPPFLSVCLPQLLPPPLPLPSSTPLQAWGVISLEQRRRHFFTYEKRVREMSSAEKSFEYFASLGDMHKGFTMTAGDVMRSVVPVFPPQGSDIVRAGRLPGEPSAHIQQEVSVALSEHRTDEASTAQLWLLSMHSTNVAAPCSG